MQLYISKKKRNETIFLKKIIKRIKEGKRDKTDKVLLQLPVSVVEPNVSDCLFSYLLLFCFLQEFSLFSNSFSSRLCYLFSTIVANSVWVQFCIIWFISHKFYELPKCNPHNSISTILYLVIYTRTVGHL